MSMQSSKHRGLYVVYFLCCIRYDMRFIHGENVPHRGNEARLITNGIMRVKKEREKEKLLKPFLYKLLYITSSNGR